MAHKIYIDLLNQIYANIAGVVHQIDQVICDNNKKVLSGFVLEIDSNFIRRIRNHIMYFCEDAAPIGVIIETNGYVWIYSLT